MEEVALNGFVKFEALIIHVFGAVSSLIVCERIRLSVKCLGHDESSCISVLY